MSRILWVSDALRKACIKNGAICATSSWHRECVRIQESLPKLLYIFMHMYAVIQVGLRTLRDSGYVLRCHKDRFEAVYYGEIGASLAMFEAGYTIDSFLTRYQGVNWRGEVNWECNNALSPIGKRTFDGLTLSAFEAIFPKLKGSLLESGLPSHFEALKMSQWLTTPVCMSILGWTCVKPGQGRWWAVHHAAHFTS